MSEEERERIRRTIYGAFDRWGQRSMETFLRRFGRGGASAREAFRVEWIEQAFLERRAKHPGLARYVLNQTLRSKVLSKHRTMLLRSALISIAAKDSPTVKELADYEPIGEPTSELQGSSLPAYTRRSVQRLRKKEYPEVFFDQGPSRYDGRSERVSTIFGPFRLPRNEITDDAAAYLAADRAKVLSDPTMGERVFDLISIREVQPEYLEAFREFRGDCDRVIGQLSGRPTIAKERLTLLHEEFHAHLETVQLLFNHILSILAVKWFRGRPDAEKNGLLEREFRLSYTKEDALRAHALIAETFNPKFAPIFLTNVASFGMYVLGLPEDGMHVYEAILELHPDETTAQAAAWDNIGICWRELGELAKAIEAMEKAIPLHRRSGDAYSELIAERNVGEALFRMGQTEDGLARFRKVQGRIAELQDDDKRFGIWFNLARGAGRCGLFDLEHEFLMKALEENSETGPMLIVQDRLLQLNLRLLTREHP